MNSPRIVVIEGPDGAGKTTLARHFVDNFQFEHRHFGPPRTDIPALSHYMYELYNAVLTAFAKPGIVLDRFALSERVYGQMLRGRDTLGPAGWKKIRDELDFIGARRVLCFPPLLTCIEAWYANKANEMIQQPAVFNWAWYRWQHFTKEPGQILYDRTEDSLEKLVAEVMK